MKCVEILTGDNKGTILRVTDEEASTLVQAKKAKYVPKSRYKDMKRGVDRMEKVRD